jgi:thiamine biosynthesis lipoprotein
MRSPDFSYQFDAIGTAWSILVYQPMSEPVVKQVKQHVAQRIEQFDSDYSRFRSDSLVSNMAKRAGDYQLPDDAQTLLDLYRQLYTLTDGAVTPLIGQVLSDAGYDAEYSLQPGSLTIPPTWDDVLDYRFPRLHVNHPVLLDFGAAGKGYLVDIVGQLLVAHGIYHFCIDAGGDIIYRTDVVTDPGLAIGLEHPSDPTLAIGLATIRNQSLCGSAGNRRVWGIDGEFHHIIDPRSLASPRHIQAVWVAADSGLLADGLATALFFTSASKLAKHFQFEYVIMRADNTLQTSKHFPAVFYTTDNVNEEPA